MPSHCIRRRALSAPLAFVASIALAACSGNSPSGDAPPGSSGDDAGNGTQTVGGSTNPADGGASGPGADAAVPKSGHDAGAGGDGGAGQTSDGGGVMAPDASGANEGGTPDASGSACANAPAWASGIAYTVGEDVSYENAVYTCIQPHTSEPGWTPSTTPSLWQLTTCSVPITGNDDAGSGATDSGGTSPSNGGDSGGPTAALPEHLLTGYWQDFTNPAASLPLASVPSAYALVAVAFANADATTPGAITFSIDSGLASALGGYTSAQFMADIATLHGRGQKVILSVGGQEGAIAVGDAASAAAFATSAASLLSQYGFDGIDIDLENGITPTYMISALQQLSSKVGPSLIITLAPQTLDMQSTTADYFQLALGIKDILTIVNMQYYNSGSMLGQDGKVYSEGGEDFLTALADIQLQGGLRPDQVGLGVPASSGAAGGGYVAPSVVNAALECLAAGTSCGTYTPVAKYPTIRGAMTWSVSWDDTSSYAFSNGVAPGLSSLP